MTQTHGAFLALFAFLMAVNLCHCAPAAAGLDSLNKNHGDEGVSSQPNFAPPVGPSPGQLDPCYECHCNHSLLVPVYKFHNSDGAHILTTDPNETLPGSGWFPTDGIVFHAFGSSVPGTVPVLRFYKASVDNTIYVTNLFQEGVTPASSGYKFIHIEFYMDLVPRCTGQVPLYRYFNPTAEQHYFTIDLSELGGGDGAFEFERIAGFVFP